MINMAVKPRTNFPRCGYLTAVLEQTRLWNWQKHKDEVALSRYNSVFHGNVNKPPIHEAYTVTFVEQPNFHSFEYLW